MAGRPERDKSFRVVRIGPQSLLKTDIRAVKEPLRETEAHLMMDLLQEMEARLGPGDGGNTRGWFFCRYVHTQIRRTGAPLMKSANPLFRGSTLPETLWAHIWQEPSIPR